MKKIVKIIVGSILQVVFHFFRIDENKIMFETCTGEAKDQVRAFYDYAKSNGIQDYQFKWAITRGRDVSGLEKDEIVYKKTLNYYYHLMTSKYWLRTHSVDNIVKKREGQVYVQLWHGPGATKKEGYDIGIYENTGVTMPHAREWDYYIATDCDSESYIETALNLKIPRILVGSCRSDKLVNMDKGMYFTIRERLGIKEGETAVLYAPTFRENDFHLEKIELKIKNLAKKEGIRVILRLHPEVKSKLNIEEYDSSVIDGNSCPDIYDLYMAADILVTDYSSTAIEYSLMRRPILYYMYDLEDYKVERNFYYNYLERLAGPILRTEEELIDAIDHIDQVQEQYKEQYEAYYQRYNEKNDGHVCERFYELMKSGVFVPTQRQHL